MALLALVIYIAVWCDTVANEIESEDNQAITQGTVVSTQCYNTIFHTCTNCGPGPDCSNSYRSDTDIYQSDTCRVRCDNDTLCDGAWFSFDSGHSGRCDYYSNCSQVQQYTGFTFYRKVCTNDTECLSYEIQRYDNRRGDCGLAVASQSHVTSEYACLQTCLDTAGCQSITYKTTGSCFTHFCNTSLSYGGPIFWKKVCHSDCDPVYLQKCINCRPGSNCPMPYNTTTQLFPSSSCGDMCESADCETSLYNLENGSCDLTECHEVDLDMSSVVFRKACYDSMCSLPKWPSDVPNTCYTSHFNLENCTCDLTECHEVDFDMSSVVFRKACYDNCSEYELFKLDDTTGGCDPFLTESLNSTAANCVDRCLDMAVCLSVSYESQTKTCSYYNCTTSVHEAGTVFFWRNCLSACDRISTQTCINCNTGPGCSAMVHTTMYSSESCRMSCASTDSCNMAEYLPLDNECNLHECSYPQYSFGDTVYRQSCNTDCLNYKLETTRGGYFQCPAIGQDLGGVDFPFCVTKCLDMIGCRGVRHNSMDMSCDYYNCTDVTPYNAADISTMIRICISEDSPRNFTQVCLNCEAASDICPRYIDRPSSPNVDAECQELCHNTTGCTLAIFDYGQCILYDCQYLQWAYGVKAYRQTYNTDCLEYKLDVKGSYYGTCERLYSTTDLPDYRYCLAECLDYEGCRAITFVHSTNSCWLHSCGSYAYNANIVATFVERQCDLQMCDRIFEQECVNCDVHQDFRFWFWSRSNIAIEANCTEHCQMTPECGVAVYDSNRSRCRMYNHTGLHVDWTKRAVRKSCRSDCPRFKLTELAGYKGVHYLQGRQSNIPTLDDCVHICLDITGCFAVTHSASSEICYFHGNTDRIVATDSTEVFVFFTCGIEECERNYTQLCLNCMYGPNCPVHLSRDYNVATIEECENTCNSSTCLQSYFNQPLGRCELHHCTQVSSYRRYYRIRRKSCTNDCPVYETFIRNNYIGTDCTNITDSGFDVIPNMHYCFEICLDMFGCMAVTYSKIEEKCTYHSNCNGKLYTLYYSYAERTCVEEDRSSGILVQKCINCGVGPDCAFYTSDSQFNVYLPYLCENNCVNYSTCGLIQYSTSRSACFYYQCRQVKQSIGQTVYRRSNNTDCPEFELFTFTGYTGNCTQMANSTMATRPQDCMDTCMDMVGCRGISLRTGHTTCYYYNCTDIAENRNYTFIKRVCSEDFDTCYRTELQTCINCWKGPTCQRQFTERIEYQPRNINTSVIGTDTDYLQIWYDSRNNREKGLYCSEVDLQVGQTIHRATCTKDCPKFEIFIHTETVGNCSNLLTSHAGGLTLHYCISKCLDMTGCRSLTFNSINKSCDYYGYCNTYSTNVNFTFFRRTCIHSECVANVRQTCLNCKVSDVCQRYYTSVTPIYFSQDCHDLKNSSSSDSDAAYYHIGLGQNQCWLYQCSFVDFSIHSVTYRDSCDSDCTKYELFRKVNVYGICEVIGHDAGSVTVEYCVQKCVDMTGCRGVSFYGNQSVCNYHNCANTTILPYGNTTFIERRCITEECTRSYTQVCLNCANSSYCQGGFANLPAYPTWAECHNATQNLEHAGLVMYDYKSGLCTARNCSLVYRSGEMMVLRKSCSPDCLRYRIRELYGFVGSCPIIGSDEGGVTSIYCLQKCLDMPVCMATSFKMTYNSECIYYSCVDRTEMTEAYVTFMWKDCINDTQENVLEPVKPYIQKCLNCNTQCTQPISSQSEVKLVSECNITCPECNMAIYDQASEMCSQYGCSRIALLQTPSSIMQRRTNNSECQEFEIFYYHLQDASLCNIIGYDEGLNDGIYCLERCLDMQSCRSMVYTTTNCTYHDCTNITTSSMGAVYAVEKVCSDDTNHLLKTDLTCANPSFQKCVNCDLDPTHCQSSYSVAHMTKAACGHDCEADVSCETSTFENYNCTKYQCDVVTPRNDANTTLYKKICFHDDCPIFEIHQLVNHEGVCDVLRTEEFQNYPSLCFERCLRMPGCRGVTFQRSSSKCLYHTCDCSYQTTNPTNSVFMWRFCLDSINNSSFTWNTTTPPKLYPGCLHFDGSVQHYCINNSSFTWNTTTPPKLYPDCLSTTATTTSTTSSASTTTNSTSTASSTSTTSSSSTTTFATTLTWNPTTTSKSTTSLTTTPTTASLSTTPTTSFTATPTTSPIATISSSVSSSSSSSTTLGTDPLATVAPATTTNVSMVTLTLTTGTTTAPVPTNIFIRPCLCSEGVFSGLTVEEISMQLVQNLTIPKSETGASKRRYFSVPDRRRSAVTLGSAGVCTLILEFCAFLMFDAAKIMYTLKMIRSFLRAPV